jgi:hypothetical protein
MIAPDSVCQPIRVEDVTEESGKLRMALSIVAESYAQLSTRRLEADAVYAELCQDEFHKQGRCRTFLATGHNPNSDRSEPLGTVRAIMARRPNDDSAAEALEIMSLVRPREGWSQFTFDDFRAEDTAEIGRFAVSLACRKGLARAIGLPRMLMRDLVVAACRSALRSGHSQFWAIMPKYVARVAESAGLDLNLAPQVSLNHARHADLFNKYDRYWLRCSPRLYRVRVERCDSATPNVTAGRRVVASRG